MADKPQKTGPNQAEHQRRAAEALRENLRRRKEQQRKSRPGAPAVPEDTEKD
ncbi:hypothetical protein [Iodidimonas sp. SYSU 1G8]|uniref:hypothetical protein n=1 Tax=Iodidimonas sp. SYSU 1G8 TaxID=3133967 RepID=UPI0031FE7B01